jgi:hypothetical protein
MVDVSEGRDTDGTATASQRALGHLFGEVSRELGALVQHEVELAKAQLREESDAAARVDLRFGLMVVTGGLSLVFLSLALGWGLAEIMPTGFAFLAVAALYAVATAVLVIQNRRATADGDDMVVAGDGVDGADSSSSRRIEIAQGRVELR